MKDLFILTALFIIALSLTSCNSKSEDVIEGSGTIESKNVTISAKVGGEIIAVYADEGSKVNKGDTLLIIDDASLRIQLKSAEATVALAKAQYDLVNRGARKEDIVQTEAFYSQAKIAYDQAKIDVERFEKLFETKVITKKQYEDAENRYKTIKSQLLAAEENVSKIKNISRPEEKKQAEARLNQAEAQLELIRKNINDCFIVSRGVGVVTNKLVEAGETVSPMSALLKISDLSIVELVIYIPETQLGKISLNDEAEIFIDSFPDKPFPGRVVFISNEAEFTPKNIQTKEERTKQVFAVKIKINNPDMQLKTGMPADAKISVKVK